MQTDAADVPAVPAATAAPTWEGPITCWTSADDEAQAEALRRIDLLAKQALKASKAQTEMDSTTLERLNNERTLRQEAEKQLAQERMKREATQQQVLCLEYELDGKEAALQVAERQLEQRDAELQEVQQQMDGNSSNVLGSEDAMRGLRTELEDKDRQLELKENQIEHLLRVLNQHGSTAYAAEDRLSSTYSAFPTMGFR
ncbi:unnamed protein product [Symbiodinium pilosum]|uniref:Uncharacterized protein n=1 Tax=Symbiodinium pilosum TaxID=2952 RepID=A0A812PXX4_SYMPI|nr:unnamed protein product [Symbiodinium pilosum]